MSPRADLASYCAGRRDTNTSDGGVTWIQDERFAYPNGGQTRECRAVVRSNEHAPKASALVAPIVGTVRAVRCGIADTFFSVPAHMRFRGKYVRGYVSSDDGALIFTPLESKAR